VVGSVAEVRDDLLLLERQRDGAVDRLSLQRKDIRRLEVSERRSRKGKGALVGMVVGVTGGVLLGVLGGDASCGVAAGPATLENFTSSLHSSLCIGKGEGAFMAAFLLGPLAASVGAAVAPGEKWRQVDVTRVSFRVTTAAGGGGAVRISVSF
jgi:hypothetical protein